MQKCPLDQWAFFWGQGLLNHLKKLFGQQDTDSVKPLSASVANTASLTKTASNPSATTTSYLTREAVFDRQNRLAGHIFKLHDATLLALGRDQAQQAFDRQLLDTFNANPEERQAGLAFIPINTGTLTSATVDRLKPANLVLILQLANDANATELTPRINQLRQRGIGIGLLRQPKHPAFTELINLVNYGVIDVADHEANTIRDFAAAFRAKDKDDIYLFACNIDTPDEHRLCYQWHFSYFHGKFAANHPVQNTETGADPHKMQLLHLMRLVQGEAETAEIVDALKQDPLLTFRILRYLNSPALGLIHKIDALSQALVILGRQRLNRWLAVLLFSVREPNVGDWLLVENALTRGRLMELLGSQVMPDKAHDHLFLTGIFSCLDRLLRRPLATLLDDMPLPSEIRDALLNGQGPYADLLSVVIASEAYDLEKMEATANQAGVNPDMLNRALLAATAWASEVTEHWE